MFGCSADQPSSIKGSNKKWETFERQKTVKSSIFVCIAERINLKIQKHET